MNESGKKKRAPKALRYAGAAVNFTVDTATGAVSTVLKLIGSIVLVLLLAGLMFACIFAYYVKTSLTPNVSLSLEDYQLEIGRAHV